MAVNLNSPPSLLAIAGVELACVDAGLRYQGRDDLVLIELAEGSLTSAVFTQNKFAAAPVLIAKQHLETASPRALLINMGNANAATGTEGLANCKANCTQAAELLGIHSNQVMPFSTGVIGEQLDMPSMQLGIHKVVAARGQSDWQSAAPAIMTTDTIAKACSRVFELHDETITITGITKGSGMICPNMATMLAFVATDARVSQPFLDQILKAATEASFNRITVDSDTSTNDAVTLSATGKATQNELSSFDDPGADQLYSAIESLMIELATSIVRDGEGATKFVKVEVVRGQLEADCREVAYAIANSPLVKTALFAADPNWGRLAMAIGKANTVHLDANLIAISVNGVELMELGRPHPSYTEDKGQAAFAKDEITIRVDLNQGDERFHVWTSDFSHEYVSINADYRS